MKKKDIIRRRYLSDSKVTLHELAEEYKISQKELDRSKMALLKN
ncbi:MAG: hypothetical protein Ct9H90mP6_05820 [Gammaproteobacteria bacterium]|nr:MAG: hypothetical protein Ct9H90mP6_05820 [Gammaproteobacteria bacterium]